MLVTEVKAMSKNIENTKNKVDHNRPTEKYREDGCLQPSPSISLTDDHEIINLDGYEVSVGDLKEHVIDSYIYRKHLKELMTKSEGVKA